MHGWAFRIRIMFHYAGHRHILVAIYSYYAATLSCLGCSVYCVMIPLWYFVATAWPPFAAAVSWTPASEEGGGRRRSSSWNWDWAILWRRNAASSLIIISRWALSPPLFNPCLWTSLHCNYSLGCRLMIILCLVPSVSILCRFISVWCGIQLAVVMSNLIFFCHVSADTPVCADVLV